jgi:hypothetical protein
LSERALSRTLSAVTDAPTPNTELTSELFERGLGLILAIAFISLGVQVVGLIGEHGIAPAGEYLERVRSTHGWTAPLLLPSWLWLTGTGSWTLRGLCLLGFASSMFTVAGYLSRFGLLMAWSLYLSMCSAGSVFFSYQWDALLLESALVGLYVGVPGSRFGIWIARALCFKLMLLSGLVKLLSGDEAWRNLSALSFHWWTQPLPVWPAVLMSELPRVLQSGMTLITLLIELIAPLAIFGPRRARLIAAGALALLQVVIAATGTYGFFNLLTLLLCEALLDDAAMYAITPRALHTLLDGFVEHRGFARERVALRPLPRQRRSFQLVSGTLLLVASGLTMLDTILPLPAADALLAPLRPFRSVNSYGLFAVMTKQRHEIALEGSNDGVQWKRYTFRYKPGALDRRPTFVTPHMPRLDWQMWFAALGRCERQPWFLKFMTRVLQGAPDVLELMAGNPFPIGPPKYLRTPLDDYHFAPNAGWIHGHWWVSSPLGAYCPPVTLKDGRLALAHGLPARP